MSQKPEDIRDNIGKVVDSEGNLCGTCFFIEVSQNKYCITCHHCIYQLNEITIETNNTKYVAEWDEKYSAMNKDIAVLRVENCPIEPLTYATQALPGLPVFVWGFPNNNLFN